MSEEILAQSLWNAMKQTDTVLDQANKEIARLRAELAAAQARIRELEASRWGPIVNDTIGCNCDRTTCGGYMQVIDGHKLLLKSYDEMLILPDDVCIMRRRPQGEGQEGS